MPQLRIPSHMSGELYITKASLISNSDMTVLLFSGTAMIMADYEREARHHGKSVVALYNARTAKRDIVPCMNPEQVAERIELQQQQNLRKMFAFLRAGIELPNRVRLHNEMGPPLVAQTSGSTAAVAEFYRTVPGAEHALRQTLFDDAAVSNDLKGKIEEWYLGKGFKPGGKYCLFWGRKSGEMSGAGLYLDTNEVMLGQMMIAIRRKDPERKLVVIGDPVAVPLLLDGMSVPPFDIDLTNYWDRGFPGGRDLSAQLYFIDFIRASNPDCVSVGNNSGILEIPHLLGMKTVYLENEHLHLRKGLRWQLLAANYGKAANPEEEQSLRTQLEGRKKKGRDTSSIEQKLRDIHTRKVDVLHQIRPGIQRFSTTTATELWVLRKSLFTDIRHWLSAPQEQPGAINPAHDLFLEAIIGTAEADAEQVPSLGQQRVAWSTLHTAKDTWAGVRTSPFRGTDTKRTKALAAMAACLSEQHGLTPAQRSQFWETFNYVYIHTPAATQPHDMAAGYRAWLRDTEEIWAYVKNRSFA